MTEPIKRLRYFQHQFLQQKDFADEQAYHIRMRRRHNRLLHSWGIAAGLDVLPGPGATDVTITAGMALNEEIDDRFNEATSIEIILTQNEIVSLDEFNTGEVVFITIGYQKPEDTTDPAPIGEVQDTRFLEEATIKISKDEPTDEKATPILAVVTIADDGSGNKVINAGSIDITKRKNAGAKIGDPEVNSMAFKVPNVTTNLPTISGIDIGGSKGLEVTNSERMNISGEVNADSLMQGGVALSDQLLTSPEIQALTARDGNVNDASALHSHDSIPTTTRIYSIPMIAIPERDLPALRSVGSRIETSVPRDTFIGLIPLHLANGAELVNVTAAAESNPTASIIFSAGKRPTISLLRSGHTDENPTPSKICEVVFTQRNTNHVLIRPCLSDIIGGHALNFINNNLFSYYFKFEANVLGVDYHVLFTGLFVTFRITTALP